MPVGPSSSATRWRTSIPEPADAALRTPERDVRARVTTADRVDRGAGV